MKIPFVDLYAQYQSIKTDIDAAIEKTIFHSSYIGGPAIKDFEQAFAAYAGVKHVVACANGTDSMAFLSNPVTVFWLAIVTLSVVPTALVYWHKTRKAEMDADLKMRMLEMGMSASDIERVLKAESSETATRQA